jgi:N-acetylated-alpha-linked acidic dipeptidase
LANAEILPFDFAFYATNIRQFFSEIERDAEARRHLDLQLTHQRVREFEEAGADLNRRLTTMLAAGPVDAEKARSINERLMAVEGNWLNPAGLPGRPWFKHTLYAARYTYAHLELPGLTEAVEAKDWRRAAEQLHILETALAQNTALLRK